MPRSQTELAQGYRPHAYLLAEKFSGLDVEVITMSVLLLKQSRKRLRSGF
jgi:hypothetical protein